MDTGLVRDRVLCSWKLVWHLCGPVVGSIMKSDSHFTLFPPRKVVFLHAELPELREVMGYCIVFYFFAPLRYYNSHLF